MSPNTLAAFSDARWYLSNVWQQTPEQIATIAEAILLEQGTRVMNLIEAPHIIDDDDGEINAIHHGRSIRGWSYRNEDERRLKMKVAREFCEGWHQALQRSPA